MTIGDIVTHELTGIEGEIVSITSKNATIYASGKYFSLPLQDLTKNNTKIKKPV